MARILVIDDDQVTRSLVRHFLGEAGYEVTDTDSGDTALKNWMDLIFTRSQLRGLAGGGRCLWARVSGLGGVMSSGRRCAYRELAWVREK